MLNVNIAETQINKSNNGWISVDDTGWWLSNTTGGFSTYQANSDFFDLDLINVKYWQPLPQPPKE